MNTLSWLIYAGEVTGSVKSTLTFVIVMGCIAIPAASIALGMLADFDNAPEGAWRKPWTYWWAVALAMVVVNFVPSSRTIYMITASEAGETVVASPDAIEMMGDLKAIIKKRLKEELSE